MALNRIFSSLTFVLLAVIAQQSTAQQQILKKAADKINSLKTVSYVLHQEEQSPFSGDDVISDKSVTAINRQAEGYFSKYLSVDKATYGNYTNVDNGKQQYTLDYNKYTYFLEPARTKDWYNDPLFNMAQSLKQLEDNAKGTTLYTQLPDSIVNGILCYHVYVHTPDSAKSFDHTHVFIAKADDMLMQYKSDMYAEAKKGGISMGYIRWKRNFQFSKYYFTANETLVPNQIPAGFVLPEPGKVLLSKGTLAPDWQLTSTDGKKLSLADLKGKVVLIDFTMNGCPAAFMALPSMEKLHKKYDGTDVAIVTINTNDTRDEVLKYNKKNNVLYPIYVNGKTAARQYNVQGSPVFYVIDKKGMVSYVKDGYFTNFDTDIPAVIEALR